MNLSADILLRLSELKLPGPAFKAVLSIIADLQATAETRRKKDRDRKKQSRHASKDNPQNVRGHSMENPTTFHGNDTGHSEETPCDQKEIPPTPPKEKLLQLTPEQNNSQLAVASATRHASLDWFEEFWKVFPNREGANPKHPALKAFLRAITDGRELSQDRASEITAAAGRYAAECRATNPPIIATRSVARALTWLNEKRWQDYPETLPSAHADSNQFHATALSPQLAAWDEYRQRTEGKTYPRDREGGWSFPSEWPPGYVQKAEAA